MEVAGADVLGGLFCGFDSIMILSERGEIPPNKGNSPGCLTQRILVCELLVWKMAVFEEPWKSIL